MSEERLFGLDLNLDGRGGAQLDLGLVPDGARADNVSAVMDIGSVERSRGLDELEREMSRNAAGAEPEPGLPL